MPISPETLLHQLESLSRGSNARLSYIGYSSGPKYPIPCIELGSTAPDIPVVGFFGGIHGLERIGTEVCLALINNIVSRSDWDIGIQALLKKVRVVCCPAINPVGLEKGTRSNANGVDLMRNSPTEAETRPPILVGGHRISPRIPWYRGQKGQPMEPEALALCEFVKERMLSSPLSLAIDCHSGFGVRDRIWFPYAKCHRPPPHLPEAFALRELFNRSYPNHNFYLMEPQSVNYCTHGDLWDHLYDTHLLTANGGLFLPLTLEMGSWIWVRKNPAQAFNPLGHFNPLKPHRLDRVLRRHLTLLNFLIAAAANSNTWLPQGEHRRELQEKAEERWYKAPQKQKWPE